MWATLSTGEHFYKNIRENTTNTNRRRNWIASVTIVKNRASPSLLFFRGLLDRKVCVWFWESLSLSSIILTMRMQKFQLASRVVFCLLVYYLTTLNYIREWTVNSVRRRRFSLRMSILRDATERVNTAQLTRLKMNLRQPDVHPVATQDNWLEISSGCFYSGYALFYVFSPRGIITVADGQNYSSDNLTRESPLLRKLGSSIFYRSIN